MKKEIAYDGEDLNNFLVLNAELHADSLITCRLLRSNTIFENTSIKYYFSDVSVQLFKNGVLHDSLAYDARGYYKSFEAKAEIDAEYTFQVHYSGFDDLMAAAVISKKVLAQIESITTKAKDLDPSIPFLYSNNQQVLHVKVKIQDAVGNDFYRLRVYSRDSRFDFKTGLPLPDYYYYPTYYTSEDSVLTGNTVNVEDDFSETPNNEYGVFNDELFDGQNYNLNFELDYNNDPENPREYYYQIDVQKISKDLYLYCKTIEAYHYYGDNPFSEPVRIHNNVKGGAGILGASTSNWLPIINVRYYSELD